MRRFFQQLERGRIMTQKRSEHSAKWGEHFSVYWDHEKDCLIVMDSTVAAANLRGIEIARETLLKCGLFGACEFIGSRIVAANPVLREMFRGQFPGDQEP